MEAASKWVAKSVLSHSVLRAISALRRDDSPIWKVLASKRVARKLEAGTLYSRTSRPFTSVDRQSTSEEVLRTLLDPWRDWEQREKIAAFTGAAFIEPGGGWIICRPWHLVTTCLIDWPTARKPSFRGHFIARLPGKGRVREESRLIHLRDWGETNYWHFLNDILGGRLRLADEAGVDRNVPLLIGSGALQQRFVQEILRDTRIGRRRFVVQEDDLVRCREVIHFETPRHSIKNIDFVLRCLGVPGGKPGNKRVFLSRRRESRRSIENSADIEELCRTWGFEVVDTENLPLAEQIKLFSQVRYLVGVHGAGLANIMFRRGAELSLLEIFPSTTYIKGGRVYPPAVHYFWLAHACGFRYEAIFGSPKAPGDFTSPFHVDPGALDMRIRRMLA
jgi:hypothetical protein